MLDSDGILDLDHIPRSLVVVGAGVIGIEYASMFAALGTRVTVVEQRDRMLDFCDSEVIDSLKFQLRDLSVTFRFGETVASVESLAEGGTMTTLASGKRIAADTVMYSAGRQGATEELNLAAAGLDADKRGRISVNDSYQTAVPHIYAVGDVIGFPALAATSMEQGRLAAYHACGEASNSLVDLQPIGIYTIPEISYCGQTEDELTTGNVPYEVGISRYRELARGQIIGDSYGMLKLLVSTDTRHLLGVHVFGSQATELVHLGQAIMTCRGTVDQLVDTVFNYPTLSEAYKVAALDVVNKMRAIDRLAPPVSAGVDRRAPTARGARAGRRPPQTLEVPATSPSICNTGHLPSRHGRTGQSPLRLRRARARVGPRRAEGGHRRRQAGTTSSRRRAQGDGRRGLHQHRHHPLQDPAGGCAVPDRPEHA